MEVSGSNFDDINIHFNGGMFTTEQLWEALAILAKENNSNKQRVAKLEKYLINAQKVIQRICPEPITFPEIRNLIENEDE